MANWLNRRRLLQGGWGLLGLLVACRRNSADNGKQSPQTARFTLTSPAFEAEAFIPTPFTCAGANQSPALNWTDPPSGTQSWTVVMQSEQDKVHWMVYDLPPGLRSLPAAIPDQPFLSQGGVQAKTDFGSYGYQGPCNAGSYFFKLYAVGILLDLPPGVTAAEVQTALQPHILAEATLKGRYQRSP